MTLNNLFSILKGGAGSGNIGHAGVPGKRGGSAPKGGVSQGDYVIGLDKSVQESILKHIGSGHAKVNNELRENLEMSKDTREIVTDIDNAIDKAPPIKETQLYRKIYGSPSRMGWEVGGEYQDLGYMSTSKSPQWVHAGGDVAMVIKVPKGTRGLDVESIASKKEEREILLPRGTKFVITSIEVPYPDKIVVKAELL